MCIRTMQSVEEEEEETRAEPGQSTGVRKSKRLSETPRYEYHFQLKQPGRQARTYIHVSHGKSYMVFMF